MFSVVITTFNRMRTLPRAIESVVSQRGVEVELIVVDDGSTDGTRRYLESLDIPRAQVVHQANAGACAARNSGLAAASGDWIVFLDDDDIALEGWLSGFAALISDDVGVVCCAGEFYTESGELESTVPPWTMGPAYQHQVGNILVGAFATRTDLLRDIGGLDERMTSYEQGELWLRLIPAVLERNLQIESTDDVLVRFEKRNAVDRPMSSPTARYEATKILLTKHRDLYAVDPAGRADLYGVLGVSAARLDRWSEARSALFSSAVAEPRRWQRWGRLMIGLVPTVGRRVWRSGSYTSVSER